MRHPPARSRDVWIFVAFLLPFAALAAHHWSWGAPPSAGDYAQYLTHARAIVEGRPYTDIGFISHPGAPMVGPRAYPPGLPLTLAPIVALDGIHSPLIRVLMLATVLGFAYIAFRRLAMEIAPWQAGVAAGFAALAVEAASATLVPLSDPGFCLLLWATVLAVDSTESWTWRRIALVTLLGFAAIAYRVAGVAVIPALGLYALVNWKRHRGRALIPAAIWSTTGLAALATGAVALPFAQFLFRGPAAVFDRLQSMATQYRRSIFEVELYPFAGNTPNDVYHVIASIALLVGVSALLWRGRRTMLTATVVMYSAVLIASPVIDARYLWPMYPVLAAGMVLGVSAAGRFLAHRINWLPRSPLPAVGVLAIIAVAALWRGMKIPDPPVAIDHQPEARAVQAWLREAHQRTPIRAVYSNPRVLTLETRVPAMVALIAPPRAQLHALEDKGITHLIWQPAQENDCRARLANALPVEFPDRFVLEYSNSLWRVYRLVPRAEPETEPARPEPTWLTYRCAQLLEHLKEVPR